jgi:pimeloyl-ACP methyl ester carboxylesterase
VLKQPATEMQNNREANGTTATVGPLHIADQGMFFVGGEYRGDDRDLPTHMSGQMYVRYQIPVARASHKNRYPVVMIHGAGQQGTNFSGTPDGRPGWADFFLARGWPTYVVDQPGRGRSPYLEPDYGPRTRLDVPHLESRFTAGQQAGLWPQAKMHSQWPDKGMRGAPAFDQFIAAQYKGMETPLQERYTVNALTALLDRIGPAVLLTHSQSGPMGWCAADARPQLVKAILAVEPNGPLFYDTEDAGAITRAYGLSREPLTFDPPITDPSELKLVQQKTADGPGLFRCWAQRRPARKLSRLAGIPILIVTGEASYHAPYDHGASRFLRQAGVKNDHLRLEEAGIHGNGHMMMLEKNNLEIAALMEKWLRRRLAYRRTATAAKEVSRG